MDPLSIANTALSMIATAYAAAKQAGLVGSPDWTKYVDAGLYISQKALVIIADVTSGRARYDALTPDEIRRLLAPADWDELEMRARAELAEG